MFLRELTGIGSRKVETEEAATVILQRDAAADEGHEGGFEGERSGFAAVEKGGFRATE